MNEEWVGPQEAARRLGVSTDTIRRWIRTGILPARRVGVRLLQVRAADLSAMVKEGSKE